MYALNISENGRVLSATFAKFAKGNVVMVNELPDGNISDYLYVDGSFVYDPIPKAEEPEGNLSNEERIAELEEALNALLEGLV